MLICYYSDSEMWMRRVRRKKIWDAMLTFFWLVFRIEIFLITKEMKKKRSTKKILNRQMQIGLIILSALLLILIILYITGRKDVSENDYEAVKPDIDVELLTVNPYSRPGIETDKITGIVVHYTANPGSTAMENRDYFEALKDTQITKASSNFIVGLDGEIVQCVPTWEMAYASNDRNIDTVSIECCHPDETGKFNDATYDSVVKLCTWLCLKYDLEAEDVIRHSDVTGKNCPKYFVEHEDEWEAFRDAIRKQLKKYR